MGYESPAVYSAEPAYNITGSAEDFVHHPNLCVPIIHVQLIQAHQHDVGERASQVKLMGPVHFMLALARERESESRQIVGAISQAPVF